jgi:dipeptidase E
MIVLTSSGLNSESLHSEMKQYIKSNMRKSVIITTASEDYKEKDKHIPRLKSELECLGLNVELFDVEFQNPVELLDYDVILINGGNPFYLLDRFNKANCKSVFEKFIEQGKIIIGVSAGSVVLGRTCELIYEFDPQMNERVNLVDFKALNIVDIDICPHYSRFISRYERFSERIDEFKTKHGIDVIKIDDGEALFIDGKFKKRRSK